MKEKYEKEGKDINKEPPENIVREINNKRIRKSKMAIGSITGPIIGLATIGTVDGNIHGENEALKKMDKMIEKYANAKDKLESLVSIIKFDNNGN
jgi:hypothetical protein